MPAAFAYVVEAIGTVLFTAGVPALTAQAIATVLVYAAEAFILAKAAEALAPKPPVGAGRGLDAAISDTGADGLAIFGTVRCSGVNVIPPITGGSSGRFLEQILALAVHPVWSFGYVGINDQVIPSDYITAVAGNSSDGLVTGLPSNHPCAPYNGRLSVRRYTGSSSQAVDWILNNRYPGTFTVDFRGRGYPYAAMTYDWADGRVFNGVPIMTLLVMGAACYDPRKDSTNGGSGTHRYGDQTTWEFTTCPALGWARLLMADFGGRVDPATGINWPSVIAAANVCDAFVPTPLTFKTFTDTANATHDASSNFYRLGTGGNAWGYGTYSTDGYAAVSLSATQYVLSGASAFGLNTSAAMGSMGTSIAYCWELDGINSLIRIYEGSTLQLSFSRAPLATDLFRIDYDGVNVYYYLNDVLYRTTPVATPGQSLYLNASGYRQGDGVTLGLQHRYTFNARLNVAQDWRNNARYFVDSMLGRMVRRGSTYYLYAGAWTASSFSVARGDWLSIDSIKVSQARDGGHWNTCRVWYVDPVRNWQRVECFARRNAAYKTADGGEEIAIQMEQPHCTDEYEAQRKGEFMLRRSRNQIALSGVLPPRFRYVTVGDVGSFTFPELGWSSKTMRVATMELGPDGGVKVGLTEEQAADWTDLARSEYNAPSTSTIPGAAPTVPSNPLNFKVQVIAGTLQFSWDRPSVVPQGTVFDIWQAPTSLSDVASKTLLWEGAALGKALSFTTNSPYWYQVQARVGSYASDFAPTTYGISIIAQPPGGGTGGAWDATISPSFIYQSGSRTQITTLDGATVNVVNSNNPTYAWAYVSSVNIAAVNSNLRQTTFTATSMTLNEIRDGTFKCTVIDGVNSKAPTISLEFERIKDSGL